MAIITKPAGGILKGVPASISLSKSELAALSIIVADSYFFNTSNWNKVILKYRSSSGKQYEVVQFDATLSSPTGNFLVSIKARDAFEIQAIEIHDFDNDIFIVPRSALNVADFDVVLLSAPSSLSYSTPVTYTQNTAITNNVPTVTGTVTSYSILPALPAGLSLNTTTGIISGTPTEASAATNYVVTASNGAGSTTATINITVEAEIPSNIVNFTGRNNPTYISFPAPGSVTRLLPAVNLSGDGQGSFWLTQGLTGDFTFTATVKAGSSGESPVQALFGLNDVMPPPSNTGYALKAAGWGINFYDSGTVKPWDVSSTELAWTKGSNYNIEIKRVSGVVSYKVNSTTFSYTLSTSTTAYIVGYLQVGSWEVTNAQLAVPQALNYINWDLLTGYQAGSLTITPTSGVSGGISLAGNDVAVKSDADKATGDFDYTFKFDWSAATSVVDMFAGVTGNNITAGTSFYPNLTCIYGNGNNPDTANLWHNGSSVGGTTQTLLSGVNTYRLKRVGTTITHYLNDVQIYSATSTSFTAYPSVRTMGNSVVTESYITEAPITSEYFTYTHNPDSLIISNTGGVSGGPSDSFGAVSQLDPFAGDFSIQFKFNWDAFTHAQGWGGNPSYSVFLGVRPELNNNNNQTGISISEFDTGNSNKNIRFWTVGGSNVLYNVTPGDHTFVLVKTGNDWKYYIDGVLRHQAQYGTSQTFYPAVRTRGFVACTESKEIEWVTWDVANKTGAGTVTTGDNGYIVKSGGAQGYNVNVLSTQTITGDGYVEFIYDSALSLHTVFGLAEIASSSGGYDQILFGVYDSDGGILQTVASNSATNVSNIQNQNVSTGNIIKIERIGTTFSVYKNGLLVRSGTINNTNPLKASVSMYYPQPTWTFGLNNVTISE